MTSHYSHFAHPLPPPHTHSQTLTHTQTHHTHSHTLTHSSNSRSLRPGSMRLSRPRPPSAREQRAAPTSNTTNLPTRAFSVTVRPDSAGAPRPYATYSPSSTSATKFRHPLPAELMNIQHSTDFGDCKRQHSSHTSPEILITPFLSLLPTHHFPPHTPSLLPTFPSPHTHTPFMQTSTLPALATGPSTKRTVPLVQGWAAVQRKSYQVFVTLGVCMCRWNHGGMS